MDSNQLETIYTIKVGIIILKKLKGKKDLTDYYILIIDSFNDFVTAQQSIDHEAFLKALIRFWGFITPNHDPATYETIKNLLNSRNKDQSALDFFKTIHNNLTSPNIKN